MRLKITIAYDGTDLQGWQRQPDAPTVQGLLEQVASRIADAPLRVHGASRTDAGVHAEGQVAHLDPPGDRAPSEWQRTLNALLPETVRVVAAEGVADDFHARHSATGKTYLYRVDTAAIASPFAVRWSWHVPEPLDLEAIEAAAGALRGDLDQRAFASRPEGDRTVRPLHELDVRTDGGELRLRFTGRSFLRYAVRGMVGALIEVGRGRLGPERVGLLARSGVRAEAPAPAPARGLCLLRVHYRPLQEPEGPSP